MDRVDGMNQVCNVLISEPQGLTGELQYERPHSYLPYVWAILKTYYEEHARGASCRWLEPIWMGGFGEDVLRPYEDYRIDVLGLSCYTWNWQMQCSIAQAAKAR